MSNTPIAFGGATLDLAEHRRSADDLARSLKHKAAQAIIMYHGRFLADGKNALVRLHPSKVIGSNLYDPGPLFLGLDGKTPIFAFSFADEIQVLNLARANAKTRAKLDHLRNLAYLMPAKDIALAGRAKSYFDWHRAHRFCAACGKESHSANGGITRFCAGCETPHFPRVNPVVIMLVIDGDKCVLGRSANYPEHAYSALAGFVSPGETLEQACVREVLEEIGLEVENTAYKLSQPWPFPGQLMMGVFCYVKAGASTKIIIDKQELEAARWFDKDEVKQALAGNEDADIARRFIPPPPFTIAHRLLRLWLGE